MDRKSLAARTAGDTPDPKSAQIWILLAAVIVVLLRAPRLLFSGRVYAEEGTVYLQSAWNEPAGHALLAPHQGYYSLIDNLSSVLAARVLPLSWAASLFTLTALLLFLLTVYLVITCESFEGTFAKALGALACVLTPSLDIPLTLEESQFCLAAAVAVIFVSDAERYRRLRLFTVLLAGLCGPVACAFVPFFWWKAARPRNRAALAQACLLTAGACVQGAVLLSALHSGGRTVQATGRFAWLGAVLFQKTVLLVFATRHVATAFGHLFARHASGASLLGCYVLALGGVALFVRQAKAGGRSAAWLVALAGWLFSYSYLGALEKPMVLLTGADRYFFAPGLLLALALVLAFAKERPPVRYPVSGLLLGLVFLSGAANSVWYWSQEQDVAPAWRQQIERWRQNPALPVAVPPHGWKPMLSIPKALRNSS